jgi:myo-inositol-1-phosphate synthase
MDLLKLSIRLFQRGMRDSGLETCEIGRLDGKSIITRSTLFSKETWKTQLITIMIKQINSKKIQKNPINIKKKKKIVV